MRAESKEYAVVLVTQRVRAVFDSLCKMEPAVWARGWARGRRYRHNCERRFSVFISLRVLDNWKESSFLQRPLSRFHSDGCFCSSSFQLATGADAHYLFVCWWLPPWWKGSSPPYHFRFGCHGYSLSNVHRGAAPTPAGQQRWHISISKAVVSWIYFPNRYVQDILPMANNKAFSRHRISCRQHFQNFKTASFKCEQLNESF